MNVWSSLAGIWRLVAAWRNVVFSVLGGTGQLLPEMPQGGATPQDAHRMQTLANDGEIQDPGGVSSALKFIENMK